jgi:hypothetical protein
LKKLLQWYDALSPTDARHLEERQVDLSPRLDNRLPHKCKNAPATSITPSCSIRSFFVREAQGQPAPAPEKMFVLAWDESKGFVVDLQSLSDADLELMLAVAQRAR